MSDLLETVACASMDGGQISSAEAWSTRTWFAGGERIGYDPRLAPSLPGETRPSGFSCAGRESLRTVSFLPGFPDGSFGWAKVRPHLPNATEMPKLFIDYVGMGDSDKPKDCGYSTAERADLVEAICGISLSSPVVRQ